MDLKLRADDKNMNQNFYPRLIRIIEKMKEGLRETNGLIEIKEETENENAIPA